MEKQKIKKTVFLLLVMAATVNAGALDFNILDNPYSVRLGAGLRGASMKMDEMVYADKNVNKEISRISYDMKFQLGLDLALTLEPVNIFNKPGISFDVLYAGYFPRTGAKVIDEDWEDTGEKFSHSEQEGNNLAFQEADVSLIFNVPVIKMFVIGAGAQMMYSRYIMTSFDGWIQQADYGQEWSNDLTVYQMYGMSSMYLQEWLGVMPVLRMAAGLGKENRHEIDVRLGIFGFVRGSHLDYHYFRNVVYEDKVKTNKLFNFWACYRFRINNRFAPQVWLSWRQIKEARGDSWSVMQGLVGDVYYEPDASGAEMGSLRIGLGVTVWL